VRALDPRLLARARAARVLVAADVAIGVGAAVLVLAQAVLLARIVVRGTGGASARAVAGEIALLGAVFALRGTLAWAFEAAGRSGAARVLSELRMALVERRLRGQPAALDGAETGEVAAVAVQGIDALEGYFARYLPQVVLACAVPVAVLACVAAVDIESALVMLATVPLVPVFMWLIGRTTERRTRERWHALRQLSTHFLDVVRGLATLRAFNRGRAQSAVLASVGERYRATTMETLRVGFLSGAALELMATLGVALVAVSVGIRLVDGGIGFEAALTVLILAPELYLPLRRLGAEFHASADGLAVVARMLDLIEAPAAVQAGAGRLARSGHVPHIRFEGVRFAYPGRAEAALDGLDLELLPGETLALVGPSGAGKSTVAALLLRLLEPAGGRICADGADLAGLDPPAWRRAVSWAPQRPVLLRGSVADNIRLADASASDERVRQAAVLAGADGFVRSLPEGYATRVGDGGRRLSAGEGRRIALARAFLRDAPLLILDEPTADLDPEAAAGIARALGRLRQGRSVLVITHHLGSAFEADRIVRIEHGRAAVAAPPVAA
jgi:ATP-binding cassette, subfamily C, bacterial CydD